MFFTLIFLIEHGIMIMRSIIEFSIGKVPGFVKQGEMERTIIADKLWRKILFSKKQKATTRKSTHGMGLELN